MTQTEYVTGFLICFGVPVGVVVAVVITYYRTVKPDKHFRNDMQFARRYHYRNYSNWRNYRGR